MPRKNPSCRWFFDDWHNDKGLQLCSLAARGLWIELLGLCQEHDGYLLINGKSPSMAALARYVGSNPVTVKNLLVSLERNGVFSKDAKNVIYNRRMLRARAQHVRASRDRATLQASILNKLNGKDKEGAAHAPAYGPPQDPVELARKLGLPK